MTRSKSTQVSFILSDLNKPIRRGCIRKKKRTRKTRSSAPIAVDLYSWWAEDHTHLFEKEVLCRRIFEAEPNVKICDERGLVPNLPGPLPLSHTLLYLSLSIQVKPDPELIGLKGYQLGTPKTAAAFYTVSSAFSRYSSPSPPSPPSPPYA